MKFVLLEQSDFRPVRLDVVFETRDELLELFARLNLTSAELCKAHYAHPTANDFIYASAAYPHCRLVDLEDAVLKALERDEVANA